MLSLVLKKGNRLLDWLDYFTIVPTERFLILGIMQCIAKSIKVLKKVKDFILLH
jgi:hypothetical protein